MSPRFLLLSDLASLPHGRRAGLAPVTYAGGIWTLGFKRKF